MDSEKVQIKPMALAAEEDLIDYRLGHPDTLAKAASRQIYLLDTSYLPSELQELAAAENVKRAEGLELEIARYTIALRRARKAAEAQKVQQQRYAAQAEALASKCEENQQEITSERTQLTLAKQKKQMHEECNALAKQLSARPRKKAELDQLIGDIEDQIEEQTKLIAAYQAESAARLEAFDEVSSAMAKVVGIEKVEADRTESDIAALDKIIGSSDTNDLAVGASASAKTLDPKASVFTPVSRPTLPTTSSGAAAGSRAAARRGKSASRASTPAGATKGNGAAAKARAETATTKKAAASAGRARLPLAGNTSKESSAPRTGGRRQAVGGPSQLGKSSISMEDGEISSNASEGTGGKAGVTTRAAKSGGNAGDNASRNKRHRDQEDGEAVKRRKVEEGKRDGVTGV